MSETVSRDHLRVEFTAPIRIESEMNKREHWATRKKRFDGQRREVLFSWPRPGCRDPLVMPRRACRQCVAQSLPLRIKLTRVGPRTLDTDNLASGFKAVRDEIARILGIDDGDPRLTWVYEQRKGKPKEYAVHVLISALSSSDRKEL